MIQAPLPGNYGQQYVAPMQQPAPKPAEYNAIKINIVEPKVQPGNTAATSPYNYPQGSVYGYPVAQQQPYYQPQWTTPVVPQAPAPVEVPQPQVINQQVVNPAPQSVVTEQPAVPPAPQPVAEAPAVTEAPAPEVPKSTIDVPAFTAQIKSDDLAKAGEAIEKVADIAQSQPDQVSQLLDTDLMESLLGVIGKDTSTLEGPTEKQKELRQKDLSGQKLTDEEAKIAGEITPLEMAERNKQYALFTTAILQNALIDEFKKTNNMTPDIKDLPGMEQIVKTVKENPNPMLRASGLAALAYNARPEYKPVMKEIFELSKQDADENVQKVAAEGLAKLDTIQ